MWAPVRSLGPLHHFVARRERSRESTPYSFFNFDVDYTAFKNGLITLFGRLEFEDSYGQQLREIAQAGSESVASYAARTTDLTTRAYPKFPTKLQLDIAVDNFVSGQRDAFTRDYLGRERARHSITWQEAIQMAQAYELPRTSERSTFNTAIANDTSDATFANSAQSTTTSSNNSVITTPCATGNSGNSRHRHKYSTSSRALQGDWRAANPDTTMAPEAPAWKFDPWIGAPYGANPNQFVRTPSIPQLPPVPNNFRQPQFNQHIPRPQFQQPREQRAPYTPPQTNLYAVA